MTPRLREAALPLLIALLSSGCAGTAMLKKLPRPSDCAQPASSEECPEICPPDLFLTGCPDNRLAPAPAE